MGPLFPAEARGDARLRAKRYGGAASPRVARFGGSRIPPLFPRPSSKAPRHSPKILLPFKERCNYNVVAVADILGSFEQAVLLAIVRLESGAYGRAILKEVQVRLERDVAAGAVQ